jgi:predicted RNA methylase
VTLTEEIRRAYDDAGEAWSAGPAPVYRALAQPVLDAAGDVSGLRVLDLGAGSGGLS